MFILKLLTVLFFLYYLKSIFTQHRFSKSFIINYYKEIKDKIIAKQSTKLKDEDYITFNYFMMILIVLGIVTKDLFEFIYLLNIIKYDPNKYITIGYLVFFILLYIYYKLRPSKAINIKDIDKYTLDASFEEIDKSLEIMNRKKPFNVIRHIIDASYFGYMLYILFIR